MTEQNNWFIDLDEKTYHEGAISNGGDFMSSHNLATFRENPHELHLLAQGKLVKPESPALAFGRAVHCYTLEPSSQWEHRFLVSDGPINEKTGAPYGRSTLKFAQFAASTNKEIVATKDFECICAMAENVWNHPEAKQLLKKGEAECTLRLGENEYIVPSQARIDWFNPEYGIVDLKTTSDSLKWFERVSRDFGYAYQMAWYRKLLEVRSGIRYPAYIIAVEKKAPYTVGVFKYSDDVLDEATTINEQALQEFKDCQLRSVYPTRFEETRLISKL